MMHRGEGEDVKRIDPFDYYPIRRFFVQFGNELNSFNKLHSLRSCNSVNSFNLFRIALKSIEFDIIIKLR